MNASEHVDLQMSMIFWVCEVNPLFLLIRVGVSVVLRDTTEDTIKLVSSLITSYAVPTCYLVCQLKPRVKVSEIRLGGWGVDIISLKVIIH